MTPSRPPAVVLNMFYTGLGIARSLGGRGVPVIGLSADRDVYGNATRYAKVLPAPDSKLEPAALASFLVRLAGRQPERPVLFPTRDHDLLFLDRFREELAPHYRLVLPPAESLNACLNKWETVERARAAGVASPATWLIDGPASLEDALRQVRYPCVLKPLEAHHWRAAGNWAIVGGRKAIAVADEAELRKEYALVSAADPRAVVQELIPGGDDALIAVGCYLDQRARWAGSFTVQKLVQTPATLGTGCILQTVDHPALAERTRTLLESMKFQGIAEVEFKLDPRTNEFKLIEINARPWDQHILGQRCGVDVIYLAYCDHAGIPMPAPAAARWNHKWLAEDAFLIEAVRLAARRDPRLWHLLRMAGGKRSGAIFSWRDPMPFAAYLRRGVPALMRDIVRAALARRGGTGAKTPVDSKAEVT